MQKHPVAPRKTVLRDVRTPFSVLERRNAAARRLKSRIAVLPVWLQSRFAYGPHQRREPSPQVRKAAASAPAVAHVVFIGVQQSDDRIGGQIADALAKQPFGADE